MRRCRSGYGIGIAPADQEAVFEEFRQVGTAERKGRYRAGLPNPKFVELHGARSGCRASLAGIDDHVTPHAGGQ